MNLQQRYLYKQKTVKTARHMKEHTEMVKTDMVANMVNHRSKGANFAIVFLPQILCLVEATLRIHAESVTARIPTGAMMTARGGTALPVSTKVFSSSGKHSTQIEVKQSTLTCTISLDN